jgi:hypothetical protein
VHSRQGLGAAPAQRCAEAADAGSAVDGSIASIGYAPVPALAAVRAAAGGGCPATPIDVRVGPEHRVRVLDAMPQLPEQ